MYRPDDEEIPLSPEGIPIDMIGHYPSDIPTHSIKIPVVDDTTLEFDSADHF